MALTKYVSARWSGQPPQILALGDDGVEYTIASEGSDVPPWPQFLAEGGTIAPVAQGETTTKQLLDVPTTLTGGPLIRQVFNA